MKVVPVILAGGIGERFWPMSRSQMPKQLLKLFSDKSMLEETIARVAPVTSPDVKPLIVTGKAIAGKIQRTLSSSVNVDLIVEPVGKNTAPAIAIAAAYIQALYGDATMVVLSADHHIHPQQQFISTLQYGINLAQTRDELIVFGIKPSRPDTGYGYIERSDAIGADQGVQSYKVKRFVEKPDSATAQTFMNAGTYLWNSGMFIWKTSVILDEFRQHMPQLSALVELAGTKKFSKTAINTFYSDCIKESIDYGIMEHSSRVSMVVGDFNWDDIGSWEAIGRLSGNNELGTTVRGERIFCPETRDSIIYNDSNLTIAAIGLKDLVVVATKDALLIMDRNSAPELKKYLGPMKSSPGISEKLF